jgi:hypothetical protein
MPPACGAPTRLTFTPKERFEIEIEGLGRQRQQFGQA